MIIPQFLAGTILAGFSHYYYGHVAAVILIRGFLRGLVGMAIFDYVLIIFGPHIGFELSFLLGIISALLVGGLISTRFWQSEKIGKVPS